FVLETPRELNRAEFGVFGPSGYSRNAIPRVDSDGDTRSPAFQSFFNESRIRNRAGSQDGSPDTGLKDCVKYCHAAHSSADLDFEFGNCCSNLGDGRVIFRAPLKSTVEVDNVQPFRTGPPPSLRHLEGTAVDGDVLFAPLDQADGLSVQDVDCRIDIHKR